MQMHRSKIDKEENPQKTDEIFLNSNNNFSVSRHIIEIAKLVDASRKSFSLKKN